MTEWDYIVIDTFRESGEGIMSQTVLLGAAELEPQLNAAGDGGYEVCASTSASIILKRPRP